MSIYLEDDDFDIQPKLKNGITKKCFGNGGYQKKIKHLKKKIVIVIKKYIIVNI